MHAPGFEPGGSSFRIALPLCVWVWIGVVWYDMFNMFLRKRLGRGRNKCHSLDLLGFSCCKKHWFLRGSWRVSCLFMCFLLDERFWGCLEMDKGGRHSWGHCRFKVVWQRDLWGTPVKCVFPKMPGCTFFPIRQNSLLLQRPHQCWTHLSTTKVRLLREAIRRGVRKGGWYGWKPSSSSNFSIRAFRVYVLTEIRQALLCRALRAESISVDSILPTS